MGRKLIYNVKENRSEYMKKYFEENKELVKCECGSHIDVFSMRKHKQSKKHIQVIELLNKVKDLELQTTENK